jgi:hypothetical protein
MTPNEQDIGPFRIDELLAIWQRVARTVEALWAIHAVTSSSAELRKLVQATQEVGDGVIDHQDITRALRVLAAQDGMHAADWLRMKAVEASMPRRKPPPALDLQLRLKGLNCTRLVAQLRRSDPIDRGSKAFRVTIRNVRGDVVSCESPSFSNALEGAIKMAGARKDDEP